MAQRAHMSSGRLSQGLLLLWGKCERGAARGLRTPNRPARGRPPARGAWGQGLSRLSPPHRPIPKWTSLTALRLAGAAIPAWPGGSGR